MKAAVKAGATEAFIEIEIDFIYYRILSLPI